MRICLPFLCLSAVALAQPNAPLLSLAVNDSAAPEVLQGAPLILELSVHHARAMRAPEEIKPITIDSAEGGWAGAVYLSITDSAGNEASWPFLLATPVSGPLKLDGSTVGELVLLLPPEDAANLASGDYQVLCFIDSSAGGTFSGWSGLAWTPPVRMKVTAQTALSPEQTTQVNLLLARYQSLAGNPEAALAAVAKVLESDPANVSALEAKGDLLTEAGDDEGALAAYSAAIAACATPGQKTTEPPGGLIHKHNLAFEKWLNRP
jgi:tetratricopeptide (TPR) repeat protein